MKFTLKLRKELEILRCLLRELGSTSDVENSIKNIVYCSVQVVTKDDGARQLIVVISNMHDNPCYYISFDSKVLKEA